MSVATLKKRAKQGDSDALHRVARKAHRETRQSGRETQEIGRIAFRGKQTKSADQEGGGALA
jgi:hypothetical protein